MSYISDIAVKHSAIELSAETYSVLQSGDLMELFEKFTRQEIYIEALALSTADDSAITVAVSRFPEGVAFNASYVFQIADARSAEETRYFKFPTIREAYAFASELELHVLGQFNDLDDPNVRP